MQRNSLSAQETWREKGLNRLPVYKTWHRMHGIPVAPRIKCVGGDGGGGSDIKEKKRGPLTLGGRQCICPKSCTNIKSAANSTEGICKGGGLERMDSLKATKFTAIGAPFFP